MEAFIEELLEYLISRYKQTTLTLDQVNYVLITKFNKKTLMYPSIGGKWMKQLMFLIQRLGFGIYNPSTQLLQLNENNEKIFMWVKKYINDGEHEPV